MTAEPKAPGAGAIYLLREQVTDDAMHFESYHARIKVLTEKGKERTAELIQKIARTHSVILVEHDMHIVRKIARKVTVLHQGQRLAEGSLAEVVANASVRDVYLGKGKFA